MLLGVPQKHSDLFLFACGVQNLLLIAQARPLLRSLKYRSMTDEWGVVKGGSLKTLKRVYQSQDLHMRSFVMGCGRGLER